MAVTKAQIDKFWDAHDPSGRIFAEAQQLARFIFRKRKQVMQQDLWETQDATAVVSETYLLQQLKDTLELRHEFLEAQGLPTHHVLENDDEKQDFLKFAKDRYHSEPEQKRLQQRDVKTGGNKKRHAGKHSRWGLEMQRRCGDKALWELVSFTGQFNFAALTKLYIQKIQQRLRKAKRLKKRQQKGNGIRLPRQAMAMIRDLDNGKLRKEASRALLMPKSKAKPKLKNQDSASPVEAGDAAARVEVDSTTKESGYDSVKHRDGPHTDIGPHRGRLTRTILDNFLDDWNRLATDCPCL